MVPSCSFNQSSYAIQDSIEPLPINSANLDKDEIILIQSIFSPVHLVCSSSSEVTEKILNLASCRKKSNEYSEITHQAEKIQKKKRGRKKRNPAEGWPKQALSGYNIFYKEERIRILNELMNDEEKHAYLGKDNDDGAPRRDEILSSQPNKNYHLTRRSKLVGSRLRKRKVAHGKISFHELVKTISSRWKSLPADEINKFNAKAKIDQERYSRELRIFLACRHHSLQRKK